MSEYSGTGARLKGDALPAEEVVRLLHRVGFRGEDLVTAGGIAFRESGWRPGALNPNRHTEDLSYGLFQVNMLGPLGPSRRQQFGLQANGDLYDPMTNARVAFQMYQANGFHDWGPYKGMEPTYNVSSETLAEVRSAAQALGLYDGNAPATGFDQGLGPQAQAPPSELWADGPQLHGPLDAGNDSFTVPSTFGSMASAQGSLQSPAALGSLGLPPMPQPEMEVERPEGPEQPPQPTLNSAVQGGVVFPVPGGRVAQGLGAPRDGGARRHRGVDIMADFGTPIYATATGTLLYASDRGGNAGLAVAIQDGSANVHRYMHLDPSSIALWDGAGLKSGITVQAGQLIGYVGDTGNAKGGSPHLHYSINEGEGDRLMDPVAYLEGSGQPGLGPVSEQPPSRNWLWQA